MSKSGIFIVFEGGEGTGKSTQIKLLARHLKSLKKKVVVTKEPGSTSLGKKIRKLLLDPKEKFVSPRTELLLYEADRAQHVDSFILPKLKSGFIVISDRYQDSSVVYQGISRKMGVKTVATLNRFATNGLKADMTFILDLDVRESFKRVKKRGHLDRIEKEKKSFHEKVRRGFLQLAKKSPSQYCVLDASLPTQLISQRIQEKIKKYL
jgi:dTMP kinase